jgi:hypothetical protein
MCKKHMQQTLYVHSGHFQVQPVILVHQSAVYFPIIYSSVLSMSLSTLIYI